MVQDDIVGHVEALPHAQMVKQGGLPKHITHVDNRDVWNEGRGDIRREDDRDRW